MEKLLAEDARNMQTVKEAVQAAKDVIELATDDALSQNYMLYKAGGTLLMGVLEEAFDKRMMLRGLLDVANAQENSQDSNT